MDLDQAGMIGPAMTPLQGVSTQMQERRHPAAQTIPDGRLPGTWAPRPDQEEVRCISVSVLGPRSN